MGQAWMHTGGLHPWSPNILLMPVHPRPASADTVSALEDAAGVAAAACMAPASPDSQSAHALTMSREPGRL